MITKEQFLAGVEFRVKGEMSDHRYEDGAICRRPMNRFFYMANVTTVSDEGFHCFTFLFGEEVNAYVKFSDCTAIVNEPKEVAV